MLRLAIVHYHLQPGGVTRVIQHSIAALQGHDVRTVVLTGEPPEDDWKPCYRVIPGLRYEAVREAVSSVELAARMVQAAADALGGPPDIWHIHNHSLGKNMALPGALLLLAERGCRLFLHIHDFAEDGRPDNYRQMLQKMSCNDRAALSSLLYPVAEHVHYGVLNNRDFDFLIRAGADPLCLHRLPNPVELAEAPVNGDHSHGTGHLWLYPTRGIRRKNIGEFLLWAAVSGDDHFFATTMGPENPVERPRYEAWKRLAIELKLPVEFELSKRPDCCFEGLLKEAHALITTSMAEGFGMAFLEPWLAGRPVCGRDIPEITTEFRRDGIRLPQLYRRLNVPIRWIGEERIAAHASAGLKQSLDAYGRQPGRDELDQLLAAWIHDDMVDFGRLDEELQEIVLKRVVRDPDEAAALDPGSLPNAVLCAENIEPNRKILAEKYSLSGYGERLLNVYQQIALSRRTALSALDGEILLDLFLAPERLCLLRVS